MAVAERVDMEGRVEAALAERMPEVDLLQLTVLPAGGGTLRLVVDHPGGVDHGVCAAVTKVLEDAGLLEEYGAEVWSPGPEPPLRTPEHFRRAVGRRVRIRAAAPGGQRSFTGTLEEAGDAFLRLSTADGDVDIPYSEVRRAHAFEDEEAFG
jgi:ribosome maturation factor RimP